MGKNADKRRARRHGDASTSSSSSSDSSQTSSLTSHTGSHTALPAGKKVAHQPATSPSSSPTPDAAASTSAKALTRPGARVEPVAWWAVNMLPPPVEVQDDDEEGSLSHALFAVTALLGEALARPQEKGLEGLRRVAAAVARVVDADTVSLLRLEPGDGDLVPARLVLTAAHGLHLVDVGLVRFDVGDGIAGRVALTGEAVRVDDAPRDPRFMRLHGQRTEVGSLLAVPLWAGRKLLGVLAASRREIRAFSPRDEERLKTTATAIALDLEQARLYREAVACPLTGLVSRVALLHAMPREVEIARRYQTQLSLVLLDADGLGTLNETHGRTVVDQFLRDSAERLCRTVRAADLVARFGGDEIAVLLPMTPANQARATAKRLVRALTTPPLQPSCTWSAGVGTLQLHLDEDATGLLMRVDQAVLQAKAKGGNAIVGAAVESREM
jgi:diguanylate cyclase (GGDEF)-like protein